MSKRILIVENSEDYRQLLQEIVEGLGHTAEVVGRAPDAWRAVERLPFDLMLLDIKMPAVHGDHLVKYMSEKEALPPTIVVSGYLTPKVMETLLQCGVRKVLAKPFRIRRLAEAMVARIQQVDEALGHGGFQH